MRNRLLTVLLALGLTPVLFAQSQASQPVFASDFGRWQAQSQTPVPATGASTVFLFNSTVTIPSGPTIPTVAAHTPVLVDPGSNSENLTPSAASCNSNTAGTCSFTATFSATHNGDFTVKSGSYGLQEAINYVHGLAGGGIVIVTPDFGGSTSTITGAYGYTNVLVEDTRSGNFGFYGAASNGSGYTLVQQTSNTALSSSTSLTDGYFVVPPSACAWTTTGTLAATGNGSLNIGASNTPVLQVSVTNAGASNNTLTCSIVLPSRLTAAKGVTITDVTATYGVQTTALTSVGAPTVSTITLPTAGTSETASTVTPAAVAGSLTVLPVIGSANLATTTAGAFFTEKVTLGTPFANVTDLTLLLFQQVFAQSAAAAQIVNTPGLLVHYNNVPL